MRRFWSDRSPKRLRLQNSLAELNQEIRLDEVHNLRPFHKLPGLRRALFEEIERPALRPVLAQPHECRVAPSPAPALSLILNAVSRVVESAV